MLKDEAKQKIQELVDKYEKVKLSRSINKYTEEETKKDFILPLFQSLGWDILNRDEVSAEEDKSDYGFYLDSKPKFYLEAKSLRTDLHREEFASQAVRYSWNKGITWAVLTDFENLKVFNAQDIEKSLADKLFFEIPYTQYLERLEQLWLLSKEAFQENLLDRAAEKVGKKLQKISVTTLLYKDLDKCRGILTHVLSQWNPTVDKDLLDEGVQKLLDRLIFLRVAEDRGIEPPTLIPLIRKWDQKNGKEHLYKSMVGKFRELDEIYDSNLFEPHPFEKWQEYSGATEKVIKILYGKKGYYEYDFKAMPADVLGSVYENYLGYRLAQSQKGVTLNKDAKKRKEQGIYYTPDFIVDYIVKNTLKPVLDKCTSVEDLKKVKVLDPSCGSGSFLIKALEVIHNKYKEFGNRGGVYTKLNILLENIYGVDLDPQAVEITRLNLLIGALDQRMQLPTLDKNIKNGNSLISGTDEELTKYFGKNFRDKKPFNWEEEFPEVFKQGGFDVVIGNPPYIRPEKVEQSDRNYYINSRHFDKFFGRFDIYILFLERAVKILRNNGNLSFIIPSSFFNQNYAKVLREWFLSSFRIESIDDLSDIKVFGGVAVQSAVVVIKKERPSFDHTILIGKPEDLVYLSDKSKKSSILQTDFLKTPNCMIRTNSDKRSKDITNKIKFETIKMAEICYIVIGSVPHDSKTGASKDRLISTAKEKSSQMKYIEGKDIGRYKIDWRRLYLDYQPKIMHRPKFPELFENKKIIIRNISTKEGLLAVLDKDSYYTNDTVSICVPWYLLKDLKERGTKGTIKQIDNSRNYDLFYLLGLINSRLLNFYFKKVLSSNLHVYPEAIRSLPIRIINFKNKKDKDISRNISILANKILQLYRSLNNYQEHSERWNSIKSEFERVDRKIDKEVYRLYGLTQEEIEIVEG